MLPSTWNVRLAHKLTSDTVLVEQLAELLRSNAINLIEDIAEDAWTADQLRSEMFGDKYGEDVAYDLNATIMELTRPSGAVQAELANHGAPHSLCSTRVTRKLTDEDGVEYIVPKTVRFATQDPEVALRFLVDPQYQRLTRQIERVSAMTEEHTKRLPGLAKYTPTLIQRTHGVVQHQLPAPQSQPPKKKGS